MIATARPPSRVAGPGACRGARAAWAAGSTIRSTFSARCSASRAAASLTKCLAAGGVHATKDRAVVENGQVVVRPMNYLAMSYDHRIIDGREAVLGLVTMKDALEDPARLLFDI